MTYIDRTAALETLWDMQNEELDAACGKNGSAVLCGDPMTAKVQQMIREDRARTILRCVRALERLPRYEDAAGRGRSVTTGDCRAASSESKQQDSPLG